MVKQLRIALMVLTVFTLLVGLVYPLVVTVVAQAVFPAPANGSLIVRNGGAVGSALIGQPFSDAKYFWSRPSATSPFPYNAAASSGSNLGPLSPALQTSVTDRVAALRRLDPTAPQLVPIDLTTGSGSGLDAQISPAAAAYQVARVARARNLDPATVAALVAANTQSRQLGFLGEPGVNVLALNLALDARATR